MECMIFLTVPAYVQYAHTLYTDISNINKIASITKIKIE